MKAKTLLPLVPVRSRSERDSSRRASRNVTWIVVERSAVPETGLPRRASEYSRTAAFQVWLGGRDDLDVLDAGQSREEVPGVLERRREADDMKGRVAGRGRGASDAESRATWAPCVPP